MPENPADDDLLDLAYPYALDAVSDSERSEITGRIDDAAAPTADAFTRIVADTHETMARVGGGDALDPPPALRERILSAVDAAGGDAASGDAADELGRRRRRRLTRVLAAAAAAVLVGIGVIVGVGQINDRSPAVPTVEQVLNSADAHTVSADVAGGTVTVSASEDVNAVVVEMTDVPPPPSGHVYQMWFVPESGELRSAGTMSADTMPPPGGSVIPELDSAVSVAVTVEPGAGSTQPTGDPVVSIPLV